MDYNAISIYKNTHVIEYHVCFLSMIFRLYHKRYWFRTNSILRILNLVFEEYNNNKSENELEF